MVGSSPAERLFGPEAPMVRPRGLTASSLFFTSREDIGNAGRPSLPNHSKLF